MSHERAEDAFASLSHNWNILLMEQNARTLRTLTTLLDRQGYRVTTVGPGKMAFDIARGSAPDLILLGVDLGAVDSPEVCRQLGADPETADVPILFVDDGLEPERVAVMVACGASDLLSTPLREAEVLARVETQLTLAAMRKRIAQQDAELQREIESRLQLDQALKAAEQSGHSLIENLSEVIYLTDARGVLTYLSPAVERLLGYRPSEAIGRHVREFIYHEDLAALEERLQLVMGGKATTGEYRVVTESGQIRWIHTSSQPVFEQGHVVGAQGILADITERKLAEDQIRRQNEFLVSVLESLTHPFYVLDAHDHTIRIANSAARSDSTAGLSTCYALAHRRDAPCDTAEHPCPIEQIKRTKAPATVEHIHYDSAGQPRYVEVYGYPLFDDDGHVSQVIEYSFDITDRKLAQEALRQSEKRHRQLLETLQEGIWVIDGNANTTFVNPRMADMLGYDVEEMRGKHLFSLMDEEGIEIARRQLQRRAQGIREQHDFEFLRKDGSRLYALLETSPIFDEDGDYVGALAGVQDISDRRRAEQALQKSEALLKETQQMARVGGWELDPATSRVTWTDEVYRIHGVSLDYQPDLDKALAFYHPQDRPVLEQAIREAIESGKPWDLEARLTTATGTQLYVRTIGRAEHHNGKVMRLSGTLQDITERKQAEDALQEAAKADERNRLARDLHDSVTQALFSANLVAEVLPGVWQRDPDAALEGLDELRSLTHSALAEMRTMLLELRPRTLIETRLDELLAQLAEAVTARAQLTVTFDIERSPKLPPDVHVTFYRVAQEALNNVVKHAEASEVTIRLRASPPVPDKQPDVWRGQMMLQIVDDGRGFVPSDCGPEQLGLNIMRERAGSVGARLSIESQLEGGTQVALVWMG